MERYSLFEVIGIETEYCIVNKNSLDIMPIADVILKNDEGIYLNEHVNSKISWSNELVNHVMELKVTQPVKSFSSLDEIFFDNISIINHKLADYGSQLMGGGMHPLMIPELETVLWKHDQNEIYEKFHSIFNCKTHGWANLQSIHLNMPFNGEKEFILLHNAIRILIPILPALCASSPFCEGRTTGFLDYRLEVYRNNQKRYPQITGYVIPEYVSSVSEYYEKILDPLTSLISEIDKDNILEAEWLNSRGAIARFDRSAIELRTVDSQESAKADMAIAEFIFFLIMWIFENMEGKLKSKKQMGSECLFEIFSHVTKEGMEYNIKDEEYLGFFGFDGERILKDFYNDIFTEILRKYSDRLFYSDSIKIILEHGCLAQRIISYYSSYTNENIRQTYKKLLECMNRNTLFI